MPMRDSRLGFELNYLNRAGEPIDIEECRRLWLDDAYRVVAQDTVDDALVSTVWLGIGQLPAFTPEHEPVVFETMVFGLDGPENRGDEPQWRYATESEARAGHATVLREVQDMQRHSSGSREDLIIPNDSRPIADAEPGSLDIGGIDKAELLVALVNATKTSPFHGPPLTHEHAAAIIQDELGAGSGRPFDFDYVDGRPIKCDLGGPRISAFHVARYDRDAGEGTAARVVSELRAALERRRAGRGSLS